LVRVALQEAGGASSGEAGVDAVVEMISNGAVGPWPPPTSWVSEWMDKGREEIASREGPARETAIESWETAAAEALLAQDEADLLARHLEELAWVHWKTDGLEVAKSLISTADALAEDEAVRNRLARARLDSLFAPFLAELRSGDAAAEAD
jgi:hypothetical protein